MTDENSKEAERSLVSEIDRWLHNPEVHLDKKSRRDMIEKVVNRHIEQERNKERFRTRLKDFLLVSGALTILASFFPTVIKLFEAATQ